MLRRILDDAVAERFPIDDGSVTVLAPDATTGLHAVLSFTAHAVVLTDLSPDAVIEAGVDGYDGAHAPDTLRRLAGSGGWIGVLDVVLVAEGSGRGGTTLVEVAHLDEHSRVGYARDLRRDVRVLSDDRGLVTLGRGLGGRTELGFEIDPEMRGRGVGRALLADALLEVPAGEAVFASCAPGNARSLRSLLAAGFRVIGGEVLIRPDRPAVRSDELESQQRAR